MRCLLGCQGGQERDCCDDKPVFCDDHYERHQVQAHDIECEHELTDPETKKCKACGLQFIVCTPCTESAGSGRAVLHTAPECP